MINKQIFLQSIFISLCFLMYGQNILPPLSQNTNQYLYQSSNNLTYISSIDGLNIFDGESVSMYNTLNSNMYGNNIQSEFFEDSLRRVWFCTYRAIHVFNPKTDSLDYFFCQDFEGNNIVNDYRIIDLKDSILWGLANDVLFQYDIVNNRFLHRFSSEIKAVYKIIRQEQNGEEFFLSVSGSGFTKFSVDTSTNQNSKI